MKNSPPQMTKQKNWPTDMGNQRTFNYPDEEIKKYRQPSEFAACKITISKGRKLTSIHIASPHRNRSNRRWRPNEPCLDEMPKLCKSHLEAEMNQRKEGRWKKTNEKSQGDGSASQGGGKASLEGG
jgi:hypothetical protein